MAMFRDGVVVDTATIVDHIRNRLLTIEKVARRWPVEWIAALVAFCVTQRHGLSWLTGASPYLRPDDYVSAINSVNYIDNGFTRRALIGSILKVLVLDSHLGLILISAVSTIIVSSGMAILLRRRRLAGSDAWLWLCIVMPTFPAFYAKWSGDLGRGDILIAAVIVWSAVLADSNRLRLASMPLIFGYLSHETPIIFGVPLVIFTRLARKPVGSARRDIYRFVAFTGVMVISVMTLQFVFGSQPQQVAETVLNSGPPSIMRTYAAFIAAGGANTIIASQCIRFSTLEPIFTILCTVGLVGALPLVFAPRQNYQRNMFLVAALPLLFMCAIAIDYGRWFSMAALNAWLFAATSRAFRPRKPPATRAFLTALAVFLIFIGMKAPTVFNPSKAQQALADHIWPPPREPALAALDRCRPGWRTMLHPRLMPRSSFARSQ